MNEIRDFLYLDQALVDSIFAQFNAGLIKSVTENNTEKDTIKTSLAFDLKVVKGSVGGDTSGTTSSSQKLELHHYMFNQLDSELKESGLISNENSMNEIQGNLTIVDAKKSTESLDGMTSLISGLEAAQKLSSQAQTNQTDVQAMKAMGKQSKDISKLVKQFAGDGVFAYIGGQKLALDRQWISSQNAPEFTNLGKEFVGNYRVLGIKSALQDKTDINSEDLLLTLSVAFSALQDILKLSTIRPIAIYRILE